MLGPLVQESPNELSTAHRRYRTIFISDLHLGTRNTQAQFLLDFIRFNESDTLYLVGDIIDGWQLKKSWYWEQAHNDVIQKILRKARKGTRVVYVAGNHDEFLRSFGTHEFGKIEFVDHILHKTADGRTFVVLHGDQFDHVIRHVKWLAHLGDFAYDIVLRFNSIYNAIRRWMGYEYWSFSAYLKGKVKNAVNFISSFEIALAKSAKRHRADGVICGHIHKAEMRNVDGILYCNTGDWVESCTALVEKEDGTLELVKWAKESKNDSSKSGKVDN